MSDEEVGCRDRHTARTRAHNGTMSASGPGNPRRGPWEMTPLLLLLVLAVCLAGTVRCQAEENDYTEPSDGEDATEPNDYDVISTLVSSSPSEATPTPDPAPDPTPPPESGSVTDELGSGEIDNVIIESRSIDTFVNEEDATKEPDTENGLSPTIVLIPVVLVVVIIAMVVGGIVINRRWNRKISNPDDNTKEDPFLDGNSTEKVPMPMFEEDIPSVLELEMEDLEQWMNKDGGAGVDTGHGI